MPQTLGPIIGVSVLVFEVSENGEKKEKRSFRKEKWSRSRGGKRYESFYLFLIKNTLAFGLQLMLNPCHMIWCMQCPVSECNAQSVHAMPTSQWMQCPPASACNAHQSVHAMPSQCMQCPVSSCNAQSVHAMPSQCMQCPVSACNAQSVHAMPTSQCMQCPPVSACNDQSVHAMTSQCMQCPVSACNAQSVH
jgi:hypothetical protein